MKKNNLMLVAVFICFAFIVVSFVDVSAEPPPGKGKYKKAYPIDIPKTGQTISYGDGDDGELQTGIAWPDPRFTDNEDGTVTDNLTGLIWTQDASCLDPQFGSWVYALGACNALASGTCGLTDGSQAGEWWLPNVRELQSLIDYSHYTFALHPDHPFTNVQWSLTYWSSTTYAQSVTLKAWTVHFHDGALMNDAKSTDHFVWCVRDED
jgi:hypothetical protein